MLYRLSASTIICHLSQLSLCNAAFFCTERVKGRGKKKLMERDRQRQRDHMEFHSFRFLSQMLFSNWLMLFLLLLTVVNSWCVGGIVWISVCCGYVFACLYIPVHGHYVGLFIPVPMCECAWVCVCVCQIWMHSTTLFMGCAACEWCVRADATHSAAMSNWNRLEPWRQGNSGCVCSLAVIFVLRHASSAFFLLLFIHNEIDSFVSSCRK